MDLTVPFWQHCGCKILYSTTLIMNLAVDINEISKMAASYPQGVMMWWGDGSADSAFRVMLRLRVHFHNHNWACRTMWQSWTPVWHPPKIYICLFSCPFSKIRVWIAQYWEYKYAAALLELLPWLGRIRADRSHLLVFQWVPGATVSQVWWLARSKSWKTDGLHTDPLMHTDTLTHTLLTLPKGQRSIVPLRWPSTHTHTHTVSEYKSADVLPTILSIVTVRSF